METIDKIKDFLEAAQAETEAFVSKGNKSAATRARKNLMEIIKLAKQARVEIQERKNSGG